MFLRRYRADLLLAVSGTSGIVLVVLLLSTCVSSQKPPPFATACGEALQPVAIEVVLALPAPNSEIAEYRNSLVAVLTQYVLVEQGVAPSKTLFQAIDRHEAAIRELTGSEYRTLVAAGCTPETPLGDLWVRLRAAARV